MREARGEKAGGKNLSFSRWDLIGLINLTQLWRRNEPSVNQRSGFYSIFAIIRRRWCRRASYEPGRGIMGVIFCVAVHCAAAYDVQQNIHMNDHADSPFVLLSRNARKCICIMQRLIGVMGNVITASTVHYFQPIPRARARARFCYETERAHRVNIMHPVWYVSRKKSPLIFSLARVKSIYLRCTPPLGRRWLRTDFAELLGETSILSGNTCKWNSELFCIN